MTGKKPETGQLWTVSGGYGIMKVLLVDGNVVKMESHGKGSGYFHITMLVREVGRDEVIKERAEARARNVDCNNPDCWCRVYT